MQLPGHGPWRVQVTWHVFQNQAWSRVLECHPEDFPHLADAPFQALLTEVLLPLEASQARASSTNSMKFS